MTLFDTRLAEPKIQILGWLEEFGVVLTREQTC